MEQRKLKLISHKLCPYVQRARIVLEEKSIPHEIEFIDLGNKPDWFREISPLGKVPVLLVDGEAIFESAVIAEYLDETTPASLHPEDAIEKARNRAWIEFASATLNAIANFYTAADGRALISATDLLRSRFKRLEGELGDGPWFNGASFSLVDAAWAPVFRYFDVLEKHEDFGFFDETPKVTAWRERLRARPSVRRAAVPDYSERLMRFFIDRNSELSRRILARRVA